MIIVYAIGEPGNLEFHLTEDSEAIPHNSPIYARCKGKRCERYLDQSIVRTMTDGEYYELQAAISVARQLETRRLERTRDVYILRRLLKLLSQLPASQKPGSAPVAKSSYIDIFNSSS